MPSRFRGFCFTLNNYTEDEFQQFGSIDGAKYVVLGREIGESGTPHIQGYVYFINARTERAARRLFPRAHVEPQRGTTEEAITYCKKDGNYFECGEPPRIGKSKPKWPEMLVLAKAGKWQELAERYPAFWIRYESAFRRQRVFNLGTLDHNVRNFWYWGPSGTGKSRKARENESLFLKKRNKWWDGYDDEEVVLIEEWSPELKQTTAQELKIWSDIYSFPAEIKGGCIVIRPRLIIITSNYSLEECFDERDIEPMRRRFNVVHFDKF